MPAEFTLPKPGGKYTVAGLAGSGDALWVAELAARHRPLLVVTAQPQDAQRLLAEVAWFAPALKVLRLPDWETLPYDRLSPPGELVSERLATLYHLSHGQADVVLVPATTALYRLAPPEYLAATTFFVKQGARLAVTALRAQLALAGYQHVNQVLSPGDYSVRGGIIDLFPMGSAVPYRIDLFDEDVDSIRTFDVDTQRSIYPVKEIRLLPAREFPMDEAGIARFRQNFRERFEGDPSKRGLYKDVSQGLAPGGAEYYLPLFFERTASLFDYLPAGAVVCLHEDVDAAQTAFWRETESRHRLLRGDRERPVLPPPALFLSGEEFHAALKAHPRIQLRRAQGHDGAPVPDPASAPDPAPTQDTAPDLAALPAVQVDRRADDPLTALKRFLAHYPGRVLIAAESLGRRETMAQYFAEHGVRPETVQDYAAFREGGARLALGVAPLAEGFVRGTQGLAFVTESDLYASHVRRAAREARRTNVEALIRDLSELKVGDPVVHESHGIGRYLGLISMDLGEGMTEFLHLEYAGGDKLYVPVAQLHVIGRYSGASPEAAPLHKLGSGQWEKARKRAMQQVRDTAAELLDLYARRAAREGHAFGFSAHDYEAFSAGFDYEETPDQQAAIDATLADMRSGKPMDRVVCGDVGFGKTEVALRAAFLAVADGKQVAVLAPTTLLAEQHYQTFGDRFSEWPVKIAELSRFRTAREQAQALAGVAAGQVDIVIGTHRLLQNDVHFPRLGLVIIDEEHRFGVRQKERMKQMRAEVDVLTLTATPIPRTLAMSMEGLRDFSVIATAPQKRLAIKTFVYPFGDGVIREAVLRELKRGGQCYFLHNEVETIGQMREKLERLLPEARIQIAHGQMRERELEHVMRDFHQQRFNVLLCTTIIETGIDIATVNTIVIHRADKFGLAQLHQLRGRVGRSHRQAYAYLLTPPENGLTLAAKKRLEAIQRMEELGSGFFLAMHDLEIRGAGEVLGEGQSGEMQEVGFNLYSDMLNAAVESLRKGQEPDLEQPLAVTTEINLHCPALLPEDYCGDVHERLVLYKRLANGDSLEAIERMQEELIDRFGLPPRPVNALLETHRLRVLAKPLGVVKIDASEAGAVVQFRPNPPIDPGRIIHLLQTRKQYKLAGPDRLRVVDKLPELENRVRAVKQVFQELGG